MLWGEEPIDSPRTEVHVVEFSSSCPSIPRARPVVNPNRFIWGNNLSKPLASILPRLCPLRVVRRHHNLDMHLRQPQLCNPDEVPKRRVVGHPFPHRGANGRHGLLVDADVVRRHLVHLRPTLAASGLEVEVDIGEGLVNLFGEIGGDDGRSWIPTT